MEMKHLLLVLALAAVPSSYARATEIVVADTLSSVEQDLLSDDSYFTFTESQLGENDDITTDVIRINSASNVYASQISWAWTGVWFKYRALDNAYNDLRFKEITIEQFIETIRRWYAGIPYSITDKNQNEQLYQSLIYAALMSVGADVQAENQTSDGRMDIALKLPDCIYIIEFKYGKTADEATDQIIKKDYAVRFAADARPVWAIGLNINKNCRTIEEYRLVQVK